MIIAEACEPLLHPREYGAILVVDVVQMASWLGRTVGCLLHLEACMVPSCTMKVSSQGGSIEVSSAQGPLDPVSEVHAVFNNRDLPLGVTKDNSNKLYVSGVSRITLTNNLKENFSCMVLEVFIG